MSRTEEMYQFVSQDTEEIDADVAAIYTAVTGKTRPTGPDLLFCQILSNIAQYNAANVNFAGNQNLPSRASGDDLDALGQMYYEQTRPEATYAGATIQFTLSEAQAEAVLIPAGTRVSDADQTIVFTTDDDLQIDAGETEGTVHATCQTIGVDGNGYQTGEICKCVDVFPYYDTCENVDETGGGSDVPDDDEYYELMRQSQDAYSSCGSEGAYIYFAKSANNDISDVIVNSPYPGEVYIYCLMDDGTIAGEEVKAAVEAQCDAKEHRPLTDKVTVSDPDEVTYTVELTYYIPRTATASGAAVQTAVTNAVADYVAWQCGKLGLDIVPDELIARVKEAGAKRCVITSPVYTVLRDGSIPAEYDPDTDFNETIPQIAKCTNIVLTNGGYEDE